MFRFFLSIIFTLNPLTFPAPLQAQNAPVKQWDAAYGSNSSDELYALQQTTDGGYILGGNSRSGISGEKSQASRGLNDYWVVKVDGAGTKQWDKTFGGSNDDYLRTMQHTADGGYVLGGFSQSGNDGDKSQVGKGGLDYWIVKLDAAGNKLWDKSFGGANDDYLFSLMQNSDGGYILGGYSNSNIGADKSQASKGNRDYWVIRLDAQGNKLWDKTIGTDLDDHLNSVRQTSDGNFIVGGYTGGGIFGDKSQLSNGGNDYWVVKLDSNGNKLWDKAYGGDASDELFSLLQTADGGFIMGGTSSSLLSGDKTEAPKRIMDFWIIKTDATGNKVWDKTLGGTNVERFATLRPTVDGGYILGGYSYSGIGADKTQASQGISDFWVVKINGTGTKIWDRTFGGAQSDYAHALQQTTDGGFIIGGYSESGVSGDRTQFSRGTLDFWLVKLGPEALGLEENLNSELKLYPNPTTGLVSLNFKGQPVSQVQVLNVLGQVVFTKALGKVTSGNLMQLDLSRQPKGLYTIQVLSGNQVITKKVIFN